MGQVLQAAKKASAKQAVQAARGYAKMDKVQAARPSKSAKKTGKRK
jgi:hypothetical protein